MSSAASTASVEGAKRSLCVVVGDVSADKHVAKLIKHIKELQPDIHVFGIGGPEMKKAGAEIFFDCQEFASIGFFRLFHLLPLLNRMRKVMLQEIEARKPDCVLLADFGGFNINFSEAVRKRHKALPIVYFISPQVWASRPRRLIKIGRNVTKMLVIFPFEEGIYQRRGIPAKFVGHPLMANPAEWDEQNPREDVLTALGLDPDKPFVSVFPGSRKQEIADHMPVVSEAVKWVKRVRPDVQFVISQSSERTAELIAEQMKKLKLEANLEKGVLLVPSSENYKLLKIADLVWAKSGTTTLETTLCRAPMLVFYRGDWLSYFLVLFFKRVKHVSWPNLLAGHSLVPELIQLDCRAEKLVKYTLDLLDVPALRHEISAELITLRDALGQGDYARNAALEILEIIGCQTAQKAS